MGDIASSWKRSIVSSASKIRPKAVPGNKLGPSFGPFRFGPKKGGIVARPAPEPRPEPERQIVVKLPESDKAKKLTPAERQSKRKARNAAKRARRKNRK